ncbi:hypothetical protein [Paenibacillus marinisediminis]
MNCTEMPNSIVRALQWLSEHNETHEKFLLGGSCSLLLQGVHMAKPPRDIDIYADSQEAATLHNYWRDAAIDEQEWNESKIYRSLLSHYGCSDSSVELVGQFIIATDWCRYETKVTTVLWQHRSSAELDGVSIPLMPLSHELVFNILREREDRVEAIAGAMSGHVEQHVDAMKAVLEQCAPTNAIINQLQALLPDLMNRLAYDKELDHL